MKKGAGVHCARAVHAQVVWALKFFLFFCFFGAVPVGRRLHAPEAESFFDMGSSGFRKL